MFQVEAFSVSFPNGRRQTFSSLVAEAVGFEEAVIVRLGSEPLHRTNENVYSYDYSGRLLWQVPVRPHVSSISPYVSMSRQGAHVELVNWDGYTLTMHPKTGIVVSEGYHPWADSRSRHPSKRRWM